MDGHELRHLAVVAATAPRRDQTPGEVIAANCAQAARIARAAFAAAPALRAFSWVAPGVDRFLAQAPGPAADQATAAGVRLIAETAASLGATLRVCGGDGPFPAAPAAPAPGRTLLWFQRYGGRDEIVRAARRHFAAHPGRRLEDGELDAWLDTAGVPDPDLMLFAGGTLEPHDTLLWQGSYAEIWHSTATGEALSEGELLRAVADYHSRHRRFGR